GRGRTIGRAAEEAGVNVETIRYYHRQGLLPEPAGSSNGFREYPQSTVEQVRFIKRAQRLGFTLAEIKELLSLGGGHCEEVRALAEEKLSEMDARIRDLSRMRESLASLLQRCREGEEDAECPIIRAVAGESEEQKDDH
ncbi:MAG: MerR family transcriptional regulator, partial [Thiohalorhabdus sp.]